MQENDKKDIQQSENVGISTEPSMSKLGSRKDNSVKSEKTVTHRHLVAGFFLSVLFSTVILVIFVGAVLLLGGKYFVPRGLESQRKIVLQEGEVIADVAQKVSPSVVSITTQQTKVVSNGFQAQRSIQQGAGTGIIVDGDGLVLTNKHVVDVGTDKIRIVLSDGTIYENVDIIGRDPLNDLALIKINGAKNLVPAKLGDSDKVRVGQKVIAIGNALGQFQNTVTTGIISGIGRPLEATNGNGESEQLSNLFQTDAAINPGNSGGPLMNYDSEVIGVNTAIAEGAQSVGFAIPISEGKALIEGYRATGEVTRPYMGVRYLSITPDIAQELGLASKNGAYISTERGSVVSGGPAYVAGIKGGDVVIKVNDVKIDERNSLSSAIGRFKVGERVNVTLIRDGKEQQVQVLLAKAPAQ